MLRLFLLSFAFASAALTACPNEGNGEGEGEGEGEGDICALSGDGEGEGEGEGDPGAGCRDNADCTGDVVICRHPQEKPFCSGECTSDVGCANNTVCHTGGINNGICVPRCDSGRFRCASDQACGDDGHCGRPPCDVCGSCPPHADCIGDPGDDEGGCVPRVCEGDDECGVGVCVTGFCSDVDGTCGGDECE